MSIVGDLERFVATLYPYRWVILAGILVVVAAVLALGYQRGWHHVVNRHRRATAVIVVVALAVIVPAGNFFLSPLWTRTELTEASPLQLAAAEGDVPATVRVVAEGEFFGADDFHFGEGTVRLIETEPGTYSLRVEDFSVLNGPDLFMYLSPSAEGYADGSINLGELKATDGAFNYEIPAGVDPADYGSVIVWCEQFAVLFATAPISVV